MDANVPENSTPSSPAQVAGGNGLPKNLDELKRKRGGVQPGAVRGKYNKSHDRPTPAAKPAEAPGLIFTPENVRPLVSLPFNLAFVKTGFEGFPLTEVEAANLSATGAMVFNTWVQVDPKWLALITFSVTLAAISAEKTMLYRRALALHIQEQERLKAEKAGQPATAA